MGSNLDGTPLVLFLQKFVCREYEKRERILAEWEYWEGFLVFESIVKGACWAA